MRAGWRLSLAMPLVLVCIPPASSQSIEFASTSTTPPALLVFVHREIRYGKENDRAKLEAAISRLCDHLRVPNSWIDLEAITGSPESLSFDPFDSFDEVERASVDWPRLFSTHAELARLQGELQTLVASQRTLIAVRRDDVGYRANTIDLSRARFMRTLELRLFPGHENDFVEAFRALSAAYERINSDTPWVVYQVNVGGTTPSFVIFVPMRSLSQNDDLLARQRSLQEAEGEEGSERLRQIARESYASTESNLYAISAEMSHVSKEFADNDPEFWRLKSAPEPKPAPTRPSAKSSSNGTNPKQR
jgi:hypothetical protein